MRITGFPRTRRLHRVCGYRVPIDHEHHRRADSALERPLRRSPHTKGIDRVKPG